MMSLKNDTEWLKANDLIDYSLLCGIDSVSMELVVGIIDYNRI